MKTANPVKLFSCDTHIEQWPTVFKDYIPEKFHDAIDKAPYLAKLWGQTSFQGPDGVPFCALSGHGNYPGVRRGQIDLRTDKIAGCYGGAKEYVGWLDVDGIDKAIVLPGVMHGSAFGAVKGFKDPAGYLAFVQGYNNYLSDFCSEYPDRLLGGASIPVTNIDDALAELKRVSKLPGIKTIAPAVYPSGKDIPTLEDDKFWMACLELDMPITMHQGMSTAYAAYHAGNGGFKTEEDMFAFLMCQMDHANGVPFTVGQMILNGLFDRIPELTFLWDECGAGWLPYLAQSMDHFIDRHKCWKNVKLKQMPSWYLTSGNNLWNVIYDPAAIKAIDMIGVDNLTWSSDFPHSNSEYPMSRIRAIEMTAPCTAEERHKILWSNAAKFYRVES